MRSWKVLGFAVVASILLAGSLQAQTATGQVKWAGVNGAWGLFGNNGTSASWAVYTSPYRAQFMIPGNNPASALLPPSGTDAFGPVSDIFCVDFNHASNTGTYNAMFTNLGSNAFDVGRTTKNSSITKYLAAASLAEKIQRKEAPVGLLNGAIWKIMSGQPTYWFDGSNWVDVTSTANDALTTGWKSVNASNWVVVTEGTVTPSKMTTFGDHQEYITQVTPEPATLLLLGTGLLATLMAAAAFKRSAV